ncbi:OmpA family protein [Parendozoicomonas haliclonae]|uniref:Chemotaxis protein LafU n=1 Tax=Parendozoicomonas haliclonae TaxID=1960125 RepID=A0A1X7AQJ4_9GAMM|nr:OmpA family protein [Parendozoicomonas haliclonae]SMA49677.1 Chemotaxis protein LafU [Parendozoicomonas haliclonae]
MSKDEPVVIRRTSPQRPEKKKSHWKSILADFVMLVLSLFVVLWVSFFSTPAQKAGVAGYFKTPEDEAGVNAAVALVEEKEDQKRQAEQQKLQAHTETVTSSTVTTDRVDETPKEIVQVEPSAIEPEQPSAAKRLKDVFRKQIDEELAKFPERYKNAVVLSEMDSMLRIEVLEVEGYPMFQRGSEKLSGVYRQILESMVPRLIATDGQLIILGHTDSTQFAKGAGKDNWDLSSARAKEARRFLVQHGFPDQKIIQVSGMADRRLFDPKDPTSAANRRVEIMVSLTE